MSEVKKADPFRYVDPDVVEDLCAPRLHFTNHSTAKVWVQCVFWASFASYLYLKQRSRRGDPIDSSERQAISEDVTLSEDDMEVALDSIACSPVTFEGIAQEK